jgi:MFS family permease
VTTGTAWQEATDVVAAQTRTLRVLSAAQIVGGIGFGAGLSVGILLAEDVTSSEGWAGVARTSTTVGAALLAVPLALAAIRWGRRWALGGGWTLAAVGSVLLVGAAMAGRGPVATIALVAGMTASGAGSAATLQTRYAAADLAPPRHRSRQLSLVVWATTIGTVLGPNLGEPGEAVGRWLGIAPMAGPFVIAAAMQLLAVATISFLRPDPLLLAVDRNGVGRRNAAAPRRRHGSLRHSITLAWQIPGARLALVSICAAHSVMVGVMTMTPVHMDHEGATITVVGLTISLHILGMYGLSPLVGAAADRFGRPPVIAVGMVVLLLATAVAGTAGASAVQVAVGLFLLGVGWSFCLVAASALLTESVPAASRTEVQGAADAAMNISAAIGAAASGPLLGIIGFGGLNALSAAIVLVAAPWVVAGLRRGRMA